MKGTHKTKRQAIAQMRALYANVPDATMAKRGKNEPTNPALWERAKTEAKKRFTVYPSAYANAWASRWYKERGGDWRKESADTVDSVPEAPTSLTKRSMVPSNGQLWSQAKNEAQARFRHLPQTYADSYARWYYREHGGTWTEVNPEQLIPKYDASADLQKLERAYLKEEWVDIARPVRDSHGLIVGYHTCEHTSDEHKKGHTCMPRRRAMKLTADDRDEILHIKRQQKEADKPIRKYGRYRKQRGMIKA